VEKVTTRILEMGEATPPPLKKVAIVGFSQHKVEAPYNDPTFEIWGLNDLHESIPRWNRWFEMHSDKQIKDYCSRKAGVPYLEGLAKLNCPVYMQKVRPEVPTSVEYPIERMKSLFGDYFTNSISFMLAMAIDEGYQVIHVYGVDMAQDCLAPDTKILTADSQWVPIGDVKAGTLVSAFDKGGMTKAMNATVQSVSRIKRPCLKVKAGPEVIASVGHKWLVKNGHREFVRTDALRVGDRIVSEGGTQAVTALDFIGEHEVVGITTTTGTIIVEGLWSSNSEYASQRPSCEFFLGVAVGRGIQIYLPKTSDLLKVRWMYGYEDEIQSSWDARVNEIYAGIQARRKSAEQQQAQAREACLQYLGAEDAIRTLKRIQVS
jgi:hypothetical protein